MEENVIECKNLTHYYGSRLIYENLNFSVKKGHIMGLLGKNGCGKTTTINILNGFLQPRSGECLIYGESTQNLSPETKRRLGYLIEGHIQYSFMNIYQIEKFYSGFYKNWNRDAYFELMNRMKILPSQKVSSMSCGQRAQVALGLILAQDPDLLILDDFSLGLDPGYRRLFVDHMREYAKSRNKTVFLTSHIIQDMERLTDDVLIMDYNRVLMRGSASEFMEKFHQFTFDLDRDDLDFKSDPLIVEADRIKNHYEIYTYASDNEVKAMLETKGLAYRNFASVKMTLEDAFIGLTGKY